MPKSPEPLRILLVEDGIDDIELAKRALKEAGAFYKLWVARDGQEALDFLQHKGQYKNCEDSPKPSLILLDVNLPKINGPEVLKEIRQNPDLKLIPTVVLTVSQRQEDILKSYEWGCNSFVKKPIEFEKFVEAIKLICAYWGSLNVGLLDSSNA